LLDNLKFIVKKKTVNEDDDNIRPCDITRNEYKDVGKGHTLLNFVEGRHIDATWPRGGRRCRSGGGEWPCRRRAAWLLDCTSTVVFNHRGNHVSCRRRRRNPRLRLYPDVTECFGLIASDSVSSSPLLLLMLLLVDARWPRLINACPLASDAMYPRSSQTLAVAVEVSYSRLSTKSILLSQIKCVF